MSLPITVDLETYPIQPRPNYPPKPVGVAILEPGRRPRYYAWGHKRGPNNTTLEQIKRRLRDVWRNPNGVLFHNAKFDLDVAETHLGLPLPPWHRIYDTLLEAFLYDPNAQVLGLKPLAENLLKEPPAERDDLVEWILGNVKKARRSPKTAGAYIHEAPVRLVRPYAIGDVRRTMKLHQLFKDRIASMQGAYDRERQLLPMILDMERRGVPVNVRGLRREIQRGKEALKRCDAWIFRRLKCEEFPLNSRPQLADALEEAELVEEWIWTAPTKTYPEGQRMVSIEGLKEVLLDPVLLDVLQYRSLLTKQLGTFAVPWYKTAAGDGKGRIFCQWNQVRQYGERQRGATGARTGRFSSTPNFQNVPARNKKIWPRKRRGHLHVPFSRDGRCGLLDLRQLIRAPARHQLFDLDYSQQELRILAHYAGGNLLQAYQENVDLDLHGLAQQMINERLGSRFGRNQVKQVGFGIIYGIGLDLLGEMTQTDRNTAKVLRKAYKEMFPGLLALDQRLKKGERCVTWGGRINPVEPGKVVKGEYRTFEYKLLNTLIQGSAADCTKEAMLRYWNEPGREGDLLISVHDELLGLAPSVAVSQEMASLKRCMESVPFEVQMKAEGKSGKTWRECK